MSCDIRPHRPGASVFFIVMLAARGSDLLVQQIETLRAAVRATRAERPFGIDAWVVLPDHMHCGWTLPEGDTDYSTRIGAIKARFTRDAKRRVGFHPTIPEGDTGVGRKPTLRSSSTIRKGDGGIWQRRFWEHHSRRDDAFAATVRYCWINPVKHGLVAPPRDWPDSSWHPDGGGDLMP